MSSRFWLGLSLLPLASTESPIKHVIVLMEENRSFDHLLGFYTKTKVNGLTGKEYNLVDPTNPNSVKVGVSSMALPLNPCDPDHGYQATTSKIFGNAAAKLDNYSDPTMSGFIEWENFRNHSGLDYCGVLTMMSPEHVPIISTLASEFAVMDRFFCSVPGPTWPNRLYMLSATSAGSTATGPWYHNQVGNLFPQKTIFDQIEQVNMTWKNYYNDTPWELFLAKLAHSPQHLSPMEEFWDDARTGNLPNFAFINPRSGINVTTGVGSNDQHPDHDINAGEAYYKDIYEALRASPAWNNTLFVITFDEHGGFYDHVPPPMGVPAPDNETSYPDKGFKFDRLGIRVPTILISPWIAKGTVVSRAPAAQNPTPNSEYDLTSIMSTARKLLGINLPPLTARDAWSSTFEHVVSESSPRTDCPEHLPDANPPQLRADIEGELPLNDLQKYITEVLAHLSSRDSSEKDKAPPLKLQKHVSAYAQHHLKRHRRHHAKKMAASLEVVCLPVLTPALVERYWLIQKQASGKFSTVQSKTLKPAVCLGVPKVTNNATLLVAPCTNAESPDEQSWVLHQDATLRPALDSTLCVTNAMFAGDASVHLTPCVSSAVTQHWAFHGPAPGNDGSGFLYFGDYLNALSLRPKNSKN